MERKKAVGFINVDALMEHVSLERVAAFYGATLGEILRRGHEIRTRCFLNCGQKEPTGSRALSIRDDHPAKVWRCHHYGCDRGGNLISLIDLVKPGGDGTGKPRGERFKEIAKDLKAMAEGMLVETVGGADFGRRDAECGSGAMAAVPSDPTTPDARPAPDKSRTPPPKQNVPLAESPNERAQKLTNLDRKFTVDIADMTPAASKYFRTRRFLSPEVCQKWRMGYLARDSGGDHAGGTMRGKVVYPMLAETGEVLTWFGRDPKYEEKHAEWLAKGRHGNEPQKFHFVKGFHRGLELFGQQASRLKEPGFREAVQDLGLIVVEGPNDVIRLDTLGVPAVGLCSNTITDAQAAKIAGWAKKLSNGRVTLMLDGDEAGQYGAKHTLFELVAKHRIDVCVVPLEGEPEQLTDEQWQKMRSRLVRAESRSESTSASPSTS